MKIIHGACLLYRFTDTSYGTVRLFEAVPRRDHLEGDRSGRRTLVRAIRRSKSPRRVPRGSRLMHSTHRLHREMRVAA